MARREACYTDSLRFIGKPNVKQRETMTNTTPVEETQDKYIVPGLERGLRLLGEFSSKDRTLSAAELARRLQVPRSTVFRLLATLEMMGFVERTDGGR